MTEEQDIRWKQRFQNYSRAYSLLREALEEERELSQLEQEGVIQRFEFTFELAWKVIKDRLEFDGFLIDKVSPKSVIRVAHENNYIASAEDWLKMVEDRNLMSHTYDFQKFKMVIQELRSRYLACFENLYFDFIKDV